MFNLEEAKLQANRLGLGMPVAVNNEGTVHSAGDICYEDCRNATDAEALASKVRPPRTPELLAVKYGIFVRPIVTDELRFMVCRDKRDLAEDKQLCLTAGNKWGIYFSSKLFDEYPSALRAANEAADAIDAEQANEKEPTKQGETCERCGCFYWPGTAHVCHPHPPVPPPPGAEQSPRDWKFKIPTREDAGGYFYGGGVWNEIINGCDEECWTARRVQNPPRIATPEECGIVAAAIVEWCKANSVHGLGTAVNAALAQRPH